MLLVCEARRVRRAGELLDDCSTEAVQLITTWEVVSEAVTPLTYRLHARAAVEFLDTVKPSLRDREAT